MVLIVSPKTALAPTPRTVLELKAKQARVTMLTDSGMTAGVSSCSDVTGSSTSELLGVATEDDSGSDADGDSGAIAGDITCSDVAEWSGATLQAWSELMALTMIPMAMHSLL
jgi:hypothetical protein